MHDIDLDEYNSESAFVNREEWEENSSYNDENSYCSSRW